MTINWKRLQQVDFSTVYYDAGQRVLVGERLAGQRIGDLGGKKVCATAGSTSIANIAAVASHPVPVAVPYWTDCLVLLQQGQVDRDIHRRLDPGGPRRPGPVHEDRRPRRSPPSRTAWRSRSSTRISCGSSTRVLAAVRADGQWAASYAHWAPTGARSAACAATRADLTIAMTTLTGLAQLWRQDRRARRDPGEPARSGRQLRQAGCSPGRPCGGDEARWDAGRRPGRPVGDLHGLLRPSWTAPPSAARRAAVTRRPGAGRDRRAAAGPSAGAAGAPAAARPAGSHRAGRSDLTLAVAVREMKRAFASVADVVSAAETCGTSWRTG